MAKVKTMTKEFHEMKEFKQALKFTAEKNSGRPVLMGVHVAEDHIIATDSYRLIAVGVDVPKSLVGKTVDKKGNSLNAGQYPAVARLLDDAFKKATNCFEIDTHAWLEGHELMDVLAKEQAYENSDYGLRKKRKNAADSHEVHLYTEGKAIKLHATDRQGNEGRYILAEWKGKSLIKDIDIRYNASFMVDAMKVFKDLGKRVIKIGFGSSQTDIITMESGNIKVILLPIRPHRYYWALRRL